MTDEVWLVKVGGTVLNYVARTEDEANEHIGPDVAQGFRAVRYVLDSARPEPTGDELAIGPPRITADESRRLETRLCAHGGGAAVSIADRLIIAVCLQRLRKYEERADATASGEELVERVANALYEADENGNDKWEEASEFMRDGYRQLARAAIEAMRPGEEATKLAALPPSGALGLAREIESLTVGQFFTTSTLSALHAKVRALVAMLERREA